MREISTVMAERGNRLLAALKAGTLTDPGLLGLAEELRDATELLSRQQAQLQQIRQLQAQTENALVQNNGGLARLLALLERYPRGVLPGEDALPPAPKLASPLSPEASAPVPPAPPAGAPAPGPVPAGPAETPV